MQRRYITFWKTVRERVLFETNTTLDNDLLPGLAFFYFKVNTMDILLIWIVYSEKFYKYVWIIIELWEESRVQFSVHGKLAGFIMFPTVTHW